MTPEAARDLRLQLQHAREDALKDAEAFDGIIHVVERLGSFCLGRVESLFRYQTKVEEVASSSSLATDIPNQWRGVHTPFSLLYDMVRDARNDAMHIGASARHLTTHAIELALILEDALRMRENSKYVSDFMVRDPVCAHLWQPVSFVRQQMLTNSFSYLPVKNAEGHWCLVADLQVAKYLQGQTNAERKRRLAQPLGEATEIALISATRLTSNEPIDSALENFDGRPLLVFRDDAKSELTGILTAFDLL
jgi:CBS domain-containing protein